MRRRDLAAEYERLYPDTGCSAAQKQERMERLLVKQRPGRRRGIIVPALPWRKGQVAG